MVPLRRKLLRDTLLLGAALTLAVVAADQGRGLASLENWAYDHRARAFQFFTPPPTDKLVHLDIDDRSLDVIGRWPWSRSTMADILNEIHLADPKVVALDIVLSEPQKITYEPDDPDHPEGKVHAVDADAQLAAAFSNCGDVILPVIIGNLDPPGPIHQKIESIYQQNLETTDEQITQRLQSAGIGKTEIAHASQLNGYLQDRRRAAYRLVHEALAQKDESLSSIEHRLLKTTMPVGVNDWHSALTNLLQEAYTAERAAQAARRTASKIQPGAKLLNVDDLQGVPLEQFGRAAVATAFVDHKFAGDPVVRFSPLLIAQGDRTFPQLGLAMACRSLGIDAGAIRVAADTITLPLPNGDEIKIPVRTVISQHRVPTVMYIPWFGTDNWETMYDWPAHIRSRQHYSMNMVADICDTRHRIEKNNRNIDRAVSVLLQNDADYKLALNPDEAAKYFAALRPPDQIAPRKRIAEAALHELSEANLENAFAEMAKAGPLKPVEQAQRDEMVAAKSNLTALLTENDKLQQQLTSQRSELRQLFSGRSVLIGLTFTASTTDIINTSLSDHTPGVIVHGAIFNAIMTRHFWRQAPSYVTIIMILLAGLSTALVTARLSPVPAMLVSVLLLAGYILLNGILLFDHIGLVVGLAGPCLAIALVWAGCAMLQTIIEARERAMITRRFQTYVDPSLVNYFMQHPEKVDMKAEKKELTVVFTDLANFTKMTERLGEKSVDLLNQYLTQMVPVIRKDTPPGYRNKFLGDGIMFFYGAPEENPLHAEHAIDAALTMQQIMKEFNADLATRGLPQLGVRVGISTGEMLVGDAGSKDAADYTVLGDAVNLGARLESANKYLGTRILMTARTAELANGKFTFCPIGKLCVVGKSEAVAVVEGVVPGDLPETIEDRIKLTTAMIQAYQAGDFEVCIASSESLVLRHPYSAKLAALYHETARRYLDQGPPAKFDGSITLTEK